MFSKACEYGIRAAVYVALQSLDGRRVSVNEIAEEIDSPIAFTAKILQQLSRREEMMELTVSMILALLSTIFRRL